MKLTDNHDILDPFVLGSVVLKWQDKKEVSADETEWMFDWWTRHDPFVTDEGQALTILYPAQFIEWKEMMALAL